MKYILLFIIAFVISLVISYFTIYRRNMKKKNDKYSVELIYIINKYKLDLNKINIKKLLRIICIVSSIDISFTVLVIDIINNIYLQILIGFIFIIPLIIITFGYIGNYYSKKGMIKNEYERNWK